MSDKELIAYLKLQGLPKDVAAADRIEELANCVAVLEAKLAKAVEALETIVDNGGAGSYHLSRTTLAELNYDERS